MAQKISIVIPNYNGENLLSKNLPQVLKACKGCEVIVVDDASSDNSVKILKKDFKQVKTIIHHKNRGFGKTVNEGVSAASGDLVLLLNSDVVPKEGFLDYAREHFKQEDIFAVGLADLSHENGKVITRGKGGARFRRGFLEHFPAKIEEGETLWVSGGSSLVDRKKFSEIGGFDTTFAPFYWEDIDLSYRARKRGYKCIFEPKSKVDHFHEEGAIKKHYKESFVKKAAYKNQFLFVWKNIDDPILLINHLIWQPYHFAKALFTWDLPFLLGFLWALRQLPQLIFNDQKDNNIKPRSKGRASLIFAQNSIHPEDEIPGFFAQNKISDRNIIKQFER
ncbi:MAG: glycosyltransferase family 2 protein [Candidatus Curtissbacteria bacterium]|nr:glycosyltransferase family 2 protein [Candidatus Curtissbacteria bacterium]